jgi:5'-nucleotidase
MDRVLADVDFKTGAALQIFPLASTSGYTCELLAATMKTISGTKYFSIACARIFLATILWLSLAGCDRPGDSIEPESDLIVLSVIGTNDVHGELLPQPRKGGLTTFSGYVAALRAAREADGGAVVLIDAGDMWQGTLESNITEGAAVVKVYNALGYTAAAIGNHEFDFGPAGKLAVPESASDDPQGALRQRAREAQFPLLGANIIDTSTGEVIDWDNVAPSMLTEVAGIKIGIVGVTTMQAFLTTIAANTAGLELRSLSEAITREASELRAQGADIVIVTAHAGSRCTEFDDPADLTSCNHDEEIFSVANALPAGLVDHIIAGHSHQGIAHVVNGIAVTSSYSKTYAFSRVDFSIDRGTGRVMRRNIFPPQVICPALDLSTEDCAWDSTDPATTLPVTYEGRTVTPDAAIVEIAARARTDVAEIKSEPLGVMLETPFTLIGNPESPLANLMLDALLESIDADIVVHNVSGGIRSTLPAGELTYGSVFAIYPFDNRVAILDISGQELRMIVEKQALFGERRAGFSGMRIFVDCQDDTMSIEMVLNNGHVIDDSDRVRIAASDFLATGGDNILTPAMPENGYVFDSDPRLVREVVVDWLRAHGDTLNAAEFQNEADRRWNLPDSLPATCSL